ncbi:MAG: YdcF family protein [Alteraurantiacibacter sp.]
MKALRRAVLPALIGWFGAIGYWIAVGPQAKPNARADVAIVLGAAVNGSEPSPVFRERIRHAIALHEAGRVERLLFTGGLGKGDAVAESGAARVYALAQGVPADAILVEARSATTRQNLVEAKGVMQREGIATAILVSDPLHMRRAMEMAEAMGLEAQASATPTTRYRSLATQAPFLLREIYFLHHFWLFGK